MSRNELRLELLKLTYTHGRDASEAVKRAQELEAYVTESEVVAEAKPDGKTIKLPPKHLRGNS